MHFQQIIEPFNFDVQFELVYILASLPYVYYKKRKRKFNVLVADNRKFGHCTVPLSLCRRNKCEK